MSYRQGNRDSNMDDNVIYVMVKYPDRTFLVASKLPLEKVLLIAESKTSVDFEYYISRSSKISYVNVPITYIGRY